MTTRDRSPRRRHPLPPLGNGAAEFAVTPGAAGQAWHAVSARVGVTVFDSAANETPSERLADGRAVLIRKAQHLHGIGGGRAWREQICLAELNGVFVHVQERDGRVHVVVADRRLDGCPTG